VIGVAALGTICSHGSRRARWLGAFLFGAGYMTLIFGPDPDQPSWERLAIDEAFRAVCPWLPPVEPGYPASSLEIAAVNTRIRALLERSIPMHFAQPTPLEDVEKHVRAETRRIDGLGLPIHVDPVGLNEVEKTMQSPLALDIDGIPLKTSLHLALRQLGLTYEIREGLLEIVCESCGDGVPYVEDPLLPVGHCLLALLAAGLGSLIAPFVAESCREQRT
jgi:hypothetical protein